NERGPAPWISSSCSGVRLSATGRSSISIRAMRTPPSGVASGSGGSEGAGKRSGRVPHSLSCRLPSTQANDRRPLQGPAPCGKTGLTRRAGGPAAGPHAGRVGGDPDGAGLAGRSKGAGEIRCSTKAPPARTAVRFFHRFVSRRGKKIEEVFLDVPQATT